MNGNAMIENINDALRTIDRLLPILEEAEKQFKSARNWGFADMLGGGMFVDLVKHYKLGKAGNSMQNANALLRQLSSQLGGINIPSYDMRIGNFVTFADFVFDGIFADTYVTSQIMNSIDAVRDLKNKIIYTRAELIKMRSSMR